MSKFSLGYEENLQRPSLPKKRIVNKNIHRTKNESTFLSYKYEKPGEFSKYLGKTSETFNSIITITQEQQIASTDTIKLFDTPLLHTYKRSHPCVLCKKVMYALQRHVCSIQRSCTPYSAMHTFLSVTEKKGLKKLARSILTLSSSRLDFSNLGAIRWVKNRLWGRVRINSKRTVRPTYLTSFIY